MYKNLIISLSLTLLIVIPWQIYTFLTFPDEAAQAYKFNLLHFTKALDGHNGTVWYYLEWL